MRETVDTIPLSDSSAAISGALDTSFDVEAIVDGDTVSVWWGPAGGPTERIFVAEEVPVLANAGLALVADEDFEVRYDNIVLEHHNSETTHYTYNAANELTRMVTNGKPTWYEYDEWGRRTLRAQGSHAAEYAYRYGDKLKGVVSSFPGEADEVAYIYDGLGKMRYRQVEEDSVLTAQTWYRYDLGWNVLGEYADHGGSFWWVAGKERGYVWEGMTALAAIEGANPATGAAVNGVGALSSWDSPRARFVGDSTASGVTEAVTHASRPDGDALAWYSPLGDGSTRGVYGAAGEVLAAVDYGPYGAPSTHNAGAAPAFSYTGKPFDDATGLYHFPYRQYDPNAARWLTRDPLGMVDGPNVYAYVMGNPVGAMDPLGLSAFNPCCTQEQFNATKFCRLAAGAALVCLRYSALCAACLGSCAGAPGPWCALIIFRCAVVCAKAAAACATAASTALKCSYWLGRFAGCLYRDRTWPCC